MRELVTDYSFNKTTKQITLNGLSTIELEEILLIVNLTNNIVLYQPNDPSKGGTVSGNVITLTYNTNTSAFANTDKLQIFLETEYQEIDFNHTQKDAFDRLVTTSPTHIKSFDHRINKHDDFFDEVITGSATSVHNAAQVCIDITCTTNATDSVKRQSLEAFEYVRGNMQQAMFSLNFNGGPKANNVRYFGLGDEDNGAFIGVDGTDFYVVRKSKTSGSVVEEKVYRTSFNHDVLDGTGESQVALDLTKHNLFTISYSWLGTNAIIFAYINGAKKHIFHVMELGNRLTTTWCQSGQLPVHYHNYNTGTTASSTTFKIGCVAIFSFGGSKGSREIHSISSGVTPITINTTEKVCAGVRVRSGLKYVSLKPLAFQILPISGNSNAYYKIIVGATLTGATWTNSGDIAEALTNNPTYTGGYVIQEGHLNLSTTGRVTQDIPANIEATLGYKIDGTPESVIIVIQTDSSTGSLYFTGSFAEIY